MHVVFKKRCLFIHFMPLKTLSVKLHLIQMSTPTKTSEQTAYIRTIHNCEVFHIVYSWTVHVKY